MMSASPPRRDVVEREGHSEASRAARLFLKRLFDICMATCALLVFSPLLVLVSSAIWLIMGRPIFFCQERLGFRGRPFTLCKFRTMRDKRDEHGAFLPDVERLTHLGRALRSATLDELPELINVLRGDMSLVGPRPLPVHYRPLYSATQWRRHEMPPGMAGPVLANGRNALSWEEKFARDVWYVDHWSLWMDIQILMLTLRPDLGPPGANTQGGPGNGHAPGYGAFFHDDH